MEADVMSTLGPAAIQGYSRVEVDQFLAAAAVERSRLENEIADAEQRIARARSAIGMHRVMVAMLLETQRELTELRHHADREAEQILRDAEREAAEIARARRGAAVASVAPPDPAASGRVAATGDSQGQPADDDAFLFGASAVTPPSFVGSGPAPEAGHDQYFEFLRGALTDESPLGPIEG
jgi:hypothetical protein